MNSQAEETELRYPSVVNLVFNQPWAVLPETYAMIRELVLSRALGQTLTAEEVQERIGARRVGAGAARNGAIAVLPLYGVLAQRMNLMTQMSGGTSTELFGKMFQAAVKEPAISAIVLDVDSPGGSVFGVQELAAQVRAARGSKPIVAVANSMAASAAYWIASQADELAVTPGGLVGSIGVLTAHTDESKAEEQAGLKTTLISAGKFKAETSPFAPLSDEARAAIQAEVDAYYAAFVEDVAKGRRTSLSAVRGGFGQGRVVLAQDALAQGMVDTVATLDQVVARLGGRDSGGARASADASVDLRKRRQRLLTS